MEGGAEKRKTVAGHMEEMVYHTSDMGEKSPEECFDEFEVRTSWEFMPKTLMKTMFN